jgi:hypothetical protein
MNSLSLVAEEFNDEEMVQSCVLALLAWFSVCGAIVRALVGYLARPNLVTIEVLHSTAPSHRPKTYIMEDFC